MNRLKLFIMAFAVCSLMSTAAADSSNSGSQNSSCDVARVVLRHVKPAKNRPNAPSRISMECFYGDGFIQPIFPEGVNSLCIRLYTETDEWTETVTISNNIVVLPPLKGTYCVECISDDGRTFVGEIDF